MSDSEIMRILESFVDRYDRAVEGGRLDSEMTDKGVQLGASIIITHAQAHYLKKLLGRWAQPAPFPLPYINPISNPAYSLPSERAGITTETIEKRSIRK